MYFRFVDVMGPVGQNQAGRYVQKKFECLEEVRQVAVTVGHQDN